MPIAMQCSLCDGYYKDYNSEKEHIKSFNALILADMKIDGKYYNRKTIDICPVCKKSFEEWLKNRKEGNND